MCRKLQCFYPPRVHMLKILFWLVLSTIHVFAKVEEPLTGPPEPPLPKPHLPPKPPLPKLGEKHHAAVKSNQTSRLAAVARLATRASRYRSIADLPLPAQQIITVVKMVNPPLGWLLATIGLLSEGPEAIATTTTAPPASTGVETGEDDSAHAVAFAEDKGRFCIIWESGGAVDTNKCVRLTPLIGFRLYLVSWIAFTTASLVYALCIYKRRKISNLDSPAEPEKVFTKDHFNCLADPRTCMNACICPWVRWADTISAAGLLKFWEAFWLFALFALLDYTFGIAIALLLLFWRQKLRVELDLEHSDCATCTCDFCFACWCPCCLIAQEARVLNDACRIGRSIAIQGYKSSLTEPRF